MNDETEYDEILDILQVKPDKNGLVSIDGLEVVRRMIKDRHREVKQASFEDGMRTGERLTLYKIHSTINGMRRHSPGYGYANTVLNEFLDRLSKLDKNA